MGNLKNAEWLTEKLGLSSEQRAYALARENIVPSVRIGRLVRFDPVRIEEFIRAGGNASKNRSRDAISAVEVAGAQ